MSSRFPPRPSRRRIRCRPATSLRRRSTSSRSATVRLACARGLRGLDSTRLLVLVDGERLNTARQATDRTGAEVGTHRAGDDPSSGDRQWRRHADVRIRCARRHGQHHHHRAGVLAGSAVPLRLQRLLQLERERASRLVDAGRTTPRLTVRVQAGAERYDNYKAGSFDSEDTRPFFASGQLRSRRHDRRQLRLRLWRVPGSVQRALRSNRRRGAELAGQRVSS